MLELFFSFLGLFFSILFSSLEIALLSSNPFQIDVWSKQGGKLSSLSQKIINEKEVFLFLILLGTNLSNIIATTFATLHLLSADWNSISIVVLISIIILIFGEILPKTFIKIYLMKKKGKIYNLHLNKWMIPRQWKKNNKR